jgi:hypothetical protein
LEAFFKDFGFEFKLLRKNGILLAQISWEKYFEEEKISVIQDVDIEI